MNRRRTLDRAVQDHLDGRMDEDTLRHVFADEGASHRLGEELAAYRTVWTALGEEPVRTLPGDFARRVAHRAARQREIARARGGPEALVGVLIAFALAATPVVATLLSSRVGIASQGVLRTVLATLAELPGALWGALAAGVTLYVFDALAAVTRRHTATPG